MYILYCLLTSTKAKFLSMLICTARTGWPGAEFMPAFNIFSLKKVIISSCENTHTHTPNVQQRTKAHTSRQPQQAMEYTNITNVFNPVVATLESSPSSETGSRKSMLPSNKHSPQYHLYSLNSTPLPTTYE